MSKYNNVEYKDFDFLNPRKRDKYLYANSNSPEYTSWLSMLRRCFDKKNIAYKDYGGRGISVCERWLGSNGFDNFYLDMGIKPSKEYSLDRIDNNKGYAPENCRWTTQKHQIRNTRVIKKLIIDGVEKSLAEWAEIKNIDYELVRTRVKRGWNYLDALTISKKK